MVNLKYDFNDIVLVPETISTINSRKEVDPFLDGVLPLMVSPMDSVVSMDNWYDYFTNRIIVCFPRGEISKQGIGFKSISLEEFEIYVAQLYAGTWFLEEYPLLLVDIANGHMQRLYSAVKRFKEYNHKGVETRLMVGNVANPKTYEKFAELGVEYIRVGIGGGSACLTSANTGVHYPMASLIAECYEIKKQGNYNTKIVADGGFRNFDDVIKALSLGADYVMLGSILNKCLESCADTKLFGIKVNGLKEMFWYFKSLRKYMYKSYRGMSTKAVQKKWNRRELKTAEGISKTNRVEYTLEQWRKNFEDYLRSAMSYTGSKTLEEFKESEKIFITQQAFNRFHK